MRQQLSTVPNGRQYFPQAERVQNNQRTDGLVGKYFQIILKGGPVGRRQQIMAINGINRNVILSDRSELLISTFMAAIQDGSVVLES